MARFRLICLLLLSMAVFLQAEMQVVLSSISQDEIQQRLNEIEQMKLGRLDEQSKRALDELWEETSEIAKMNDRCATLSLTEVQDDECSYFYNTTLPDFETKFFQVTGEIRMNSWELEKGVAQKGQMIQSCYDAFPLESADPRRYFVPDGSVLPEPLMDGEVEVTYKLKFSASEGRLESVVKQMREWFRSCSPFILRNGEYEFAPMFVQLVKSDGRETEALHLQMDSGKRFSIVSTKGIKAVYSLNGETLMEFTIPAKTVLFEISVWGDVEFGNFTSGTSNSGRIQLSNRVVSKGLRGYVEWDVSRFIKASTSAPVYSASSPAYETEDSLYGEESKETIPQYVSSGIHLGFQFRTGIGGGVPGVVSDKLKERYSDVWYSSSNSEVVADSSFGHGYWPWLLVMRVYSGNLAMGLGGGGALSWLMTAETHGFEANEEVILKTGVAPVGTFEFGYRSSIFSKDKKDLTYNLEFGVRETVMFESEWVTCLTGAYIKFFDVFDLEIGWHFAKDMLNGVYVTINVSFPPHTEN